MTVEEAVTAILACVTDGNHRGHPELCGPMMAACIQAVADSEVEAAVINERGRCARQAEWDARQSGGSNVTAMSIRRGSPNAG